MKKALWFATIILMLSTAAILHACKKGDVGTVETLLARSTWQLASVQRFNYIGSTITSTDTLNTTCNRDQTFTFSNDGTCIYKNFSCLDQSATGNWALSEDKLTLKSRISVKDTSGTTFITATPFVNARIINLGQFSMVLETGDISDFYRPDQKRHIKRYGFIRF